MALGTGMAVAFGRAMVVAVVVILVLVVEGVLYGVASQLRRSVWLVALLKEDTG